MARAAQQHGHLHHHPRSLEAAPLAESLVTKTIVQMADVVRRDGSSTTTTNVCASNKKANGCTLPADGNTATIPIVLGVVIPIAFALALFFYLHRRHVNRLRREDAMDKTNSLDFGMDSTTSRKRAGSGKAEMSVSEKDLERSLRRGRGMSMDLDGGNPYLLPPGLHNSRESLHSLSRTIHAGEDRYRTATNFIPGENSIHSQSASRKLRDDSSSYTGSSTGGFVQDPMNQHLVRNAQQMARSAPMTGPSSLANPSSPPNGQYRSPPPPPGSMQTELEGSSRENLLAMPEFEASDSSRTSEGVNIRNSDKYLGNLIHGMESSVDNREPSPKPTSNPNLPTPRSTSDQARPRKQSLPPFARTAMQAPIHELVEEKNHHRDGYFDGPKQPSGPIPTIQYHKDNESSSPSQQSTPFFTPGESTARPNPNHGLGIDPRRMSIMRPLPPREATDNPEQRANRIRSFYKEYFDDSQPAKAYAPAPETYYEDYGEEFQGDGTIFDPATGRFVVPQAQPYVEPITRRAMTPPPRAPPRFQQGLNPHRSNVSNSQPYLDGRARAYSSASGRYGQANRRPAARPLPPPAALPTLPTPHLLAKADVLALPMDFAPPSSYRERTAGRPNSPRGEMRPYSPRVAPHVPLASAFNELPAMPSPHNLRKSGAFTALDFAPPPRFKNSDSGSDAGSIRSGRSNVSARSAAQIHNIRNGAYRVSRIPKEMVGTRNDIMQSLKPTWTQRPHDA